MKPNVLLQAHQVLFILQHKVSKSRSKASDSHKRGSRWRAVLKEGRKDVPEPVVALIL